MGFGNGLASALSHSCLRYFYWFWCKWKE